MSMNPGVTQQPLASTVRAGWAPRQRANGGDPVALYGHIGSDRPACRSRR